jgi:hypothetical protein
MEASLTPTFGQRLTNLFKILVMTAVFTTVGAVGISAWHAYGERTKLAIAELVPRLTSIMSSRQDQLAALSSVPTANAVQGNADGPVAIATLSGDMTSGDMTQLLQSLARDVAAMGQDISELKERMGRLSVGQDQIARDVARIRQPASPRLDVRSAMAAAPAPGASAAPDQRRSPSSLPSPMPRPARP